MLQPAAPSADLAWPCGAGRVHRTGGVPKSFYFKQATERGAQGRSANSRSSTLYQHHHPHHHQHLFLLLLRTTSYKGQFTEKGEIIITDLVILPDQLNGPTQGPYKRQRTGEKRECTSLAGAILKHAIPVLQLANLTPLSHSGLNLKFKLY